MNETVKYAVNDINLKLVAPIDPTWVGVEREMKAWTVRKLEHFLPRTWSHFIITLHHFTMGIFEFQIVIPVNITHAFNCQTLAGNSTCLC